jgi:hypothetical protein
MLSEEARSNVLVVPGWLPTPTGPSLDEVGKATGIARRMAPFAASAIDGPGY